MARDIAEYCGFSEGMTYSFESPKVFDKLRLPADSKLRQGIVISNPLGEDYSVMRTTTLNGMLSSLATNYNRRNKDVRLYELGNVYRPKALPLTELPDERMHLSLIHIYGITADVILGAKTKDMVILEKELGEVSNLYVTTDDGSYGRAGMVTKTLEDLVTNEGKHYDVCVAIGPMIMMKFVCLLTKKLGIHTIVSMNPIMVDGTGMCGACRLQVGDEIKFACVDGPEFDGHLVDFDQAMKRSQMYKTEEGRALLKLQEGDTHHGGCGHCGGDK